MTWSAAITGLSLRTPLGHDLASVASRLLAGERAAAPNAHFDARTYPCHLAAILPGAPRPSKHRRFVKRMGLWGLETAAEAFSSARTPAAGPRLGVFCGYGGLRAHWDDLMPVLERQLDDGSAEGSWERGFSQLHPFWMLFHLSNNAHALIAMDLGAKGDGITTGGANAGVQALEAAILALAERRIDAALVFGYDSLVETETLLSLGTTGTATGAMLDSLVAPYDEVAAGIVPGEAAAALVLERVEDAGERAMAYLQAATAADGADAWPAPRTVAGALARLQKAAGALVDGAGLASPAHDTAERAAIAEILEEDVLLCATSAATGHLGGASALVQALLLAECLKRGVAPPIAGLVRPAGGRLRPLMAPAPIDTKVAFGLSAGMPGLAGAIRVELP
jgi:3-oxoacyl-[acyl-carrier-protein] synthase II